MDATSRHSREPTARGARAVGKPATHWVAARQKSPRRLVRAFTLIELLVVISVVALLVAILLPALQNAREKARVVICASQLHQHSIAILAYSQDNSQWIPVANAYVGVDNDAQEYDWFITTPDGVNHHWISNLTSLFPDYLVTQRLWLCPSFQGKAIDPDDYAFWYSWMEKGGPLNPAAYKRSSYLYTPWRNISGALTTNTGSGVYGQGSVRVEHKWYNSPQPTLVNATVIMCDNVADGRLVGGAEGCLAPGGTFFASQHFNGHNVGGNVMHGDGSVEWVSIDTGRWSWAGNGYLDVSDQ